METESFEDKVVAEILNRNFIAIKVDRELRPDLDSIYMSVCQAMTGSGGWPMSIFLTPEQKPFFAGTYFPKMGAYGQMGFMELLLVIDRKWKEEKEILQASADAALSIFSQKENVMPASTEDILEKAFQNYKYSFDKENGGFGNAPKFPAPHNLLFLLEYNQYRNNKTALEMVEITLEKMYKGGIFDHIGGGFSRYSTDAYYLIPHFEKMLYDNALLMMAYARTYQQTGKEQYRTAAVKTAEFVLREMTDEDGGGFYSAMDADSEGEEGKFYTLRPEEVIQVLGKELGEQYNRYYGITRMGNFEGKNIPNLLHHHKYVDVNRFEQAHQSLYQYRKNRTKLHLDDKILTSWNYLMIGSFAVMYQVFEQEEYLQAAQKAAEFIEERLIDADILYVGYRDGSRMVKGFMDEYAYGIFAMLKLYDATLEQKYLMQAKKFLAKIRQEFADEQNGGYFLNGSENEATISRPKETYDGAIPSGNSVMAYNLVRLKELCPGEEIAHEAKQQLAYMSGTAADYPNGYSFFLLAFLAETKPPEHIVCVRPNPADIVQLRRRTGLGANVITLEEPTEQYPLINETTTYYLCRNYSCLPPVNSLQELKLSEK